MNVLTGEDHARIEALAERGWKSGRIAQAIGKKTSTVYWHMLRQGLVERTQPEKNRRTEPYKRGERWVYPYSREEDAFIEKLRADGASFTTIAQQVSERFGKPRNHHSIFVRLTILAATTDRAAS